MIKALAILGLILLAVFNAYLTYIFGESFILWGAITGGLYGFFVLAPAFSGLF